MRILLRTLLTIVFFALCLNTYGQSDKSLHLNYQLLDSLPDELGVAGAFTGLLGQDKDILFVAGGANFPKPYWDSSKVFHSRCFVGKREKGKGDVGTWGRGDKNQDESGSPGHGDVG
ncbi:MAG: hypothetical protein HOK84_02000, partial [Bacteroidetes bacterium]|nr:hypothetical protein [Bacteroidota bacterium]